MAQKSRICRGTVVSGGSRLSLRGLGFLKKTSESGEKHRSRCMSFPMKQVTFADAGYPGRRKQTARSCS